MKYQKACQNSLFPIEFMLTPVLITYIDYDHILHNCPSVGACLAKSTGTVGCPVIGNGLSHAITSSEASCGRIG